MRSEPDDRPARALRLPRPMARQVMDLRIAWPRRSAAISDANAAAPPSALGLQAFDPRTLTAKIWPAMSWKKILKIHFKVNREEAGRVRPRSCSGRVAPATINQRRSMRHVACRELCGDQGSPGRFDDNFFSGFSVNDFGKMTERGLCRRRRGGFYRAVNAPVERYMNCTGPPQDAPPGVSESSRARARALLR
ncbi:hypothetical protein OAO87_00975 [bacterium]|nr:hypothetical protein [bacterium]